MIYGKLDEFESMGLAALGGTVLHSVSWIRNLPADPKDGRYVLDGDGLYALVLRYATAEIAECRFETHRNYVDLQYTIAGSEIIHWAPRSALANDGEYDAEKDLLFHRDGPACGYVVKSAGFFSLYTPMDAHRPKVRAEGYDSVFKLVVKIPVARFLVS